jgi:hypothetical protein
VREVLAACFPTAEVYRCIFDSIRVRIIDPRFKGKNRIRREKLVLPLIHALPVDVQDQIIVLLLLAPGEEGGSIMNFEFENPPRRMS